MLRAACRAVAPAARARGLLGALPRPYATVPSEEMYTAVHFRRTAQVHPLKPPTWKNPTQNHVWSEEELDEALAVQTHVKPQNLTDRVMLGIVRGAYWTFNKLTGYKHEDPTPKSIILRLLFLESIAGVPGMVAASIRHFRSLRSMRRDHGWIHTLLEEAENERMHLLVFMKIFEPTWITRALVIVAQGVLVTLLTGTYAIRPQAVHRFVGYLEETAVITYSQVITHLNTPGSQLHAAWKDLEVPNIARQYWRLPETARFVDLIRYIAADETHHRDVNHTFASMQKHETNPFVHTHLENAALEWRTPTAADTPTPNVPHGIGSFPKNSAT